MTRRTGPDATGRVEPISARSRPRDMTIRSGLRPVAATALVLALASCAQHGGPATPASGPPSAERPAAEGLVLRAELVGGFVSPAEQAARLPMASVYADGRVLSEGPVAAIYPGRALPNVQEQRIGPAAV